MRRPPNQDPKAASRGRSWTGQLLLAFVSPLAFIGVLELGLRLAGYGYSTNFVVRTAAGDGYVSNVKFGWRFMTPELARDPLPIFLAAPKPPGTYRIFVLGESAAWGSPDPTVSFSRILEVMLRRAAPDRRWEVINTGMVAINSHVIRAIVRDCARFEPDLFIVYAGHNEVVGPYGAGTVFGRFSPHLTMIRGSLALKSTRTGQLLTRWLRPLSASRGGPAHWRGMELFLDRRLPASASQLPHVYRHFEANLGEIVAMAGRAGVPVVLCTVATNLRDNPPFASLHRSDLTVDEKERWDRLYAAGIDRESAGQPGQAIDSYRAAAQLDDQYAELHFRLGRCHRARGDHAAALRHYRLAGDLDALRFRADSKINEAIRTVAAAHARDQVILLDAEPLLASDPTVVDGVAGREMFYDHVHLNFEGNYRLARALCERVAGRVPEVRLEAVPSPEECEVALAYTDWSRCRNAAVMRQVIGRPPFTLQLDRTERSAAAEQATRAACDALTPATLENAAQLHEQALAEHPDDWLLCEALGRLEYARGRFAQAAARREKLVQRFPDRAALRLALADALFNSGKAPEAMAQYAEAIRLKPFDAAAYNHAGNALQALGHNDQAVDFLHQAVRREPELGRFHMDLADALRRRGQWEEALIEYRAALRLEPEFGSGHLRQAIAEFEAGRRERAEQELEAARRPAASPSVGDRLDE